jgi:hypothetical protein
LYVNLPNGDDFGEQLDIDGDVVIASAAGQAEAGFSAAGAAYVFERDGQGWSAPIRLVAPDPSANARFGTRVRLSGDTALVVSKTGGYVFVRGGGSWALQDELVPSAPAATILGGQLHGDRVLLIMEGEPFPFLSTRVVEFERQGATWSQTSEIQVSTGTTFLERVEFDGDTAIIGISGLPFSQDAIILEKDGAAWTQAGTLAPTYPVNAQLEDFAISGDVAAIGYGEDNHVGHTTGAVYLFERSTDTWDPAQVIVPGDEPNEIGGFGSAVDIDGDRLLVGNPKARPHGLVSEGASYVYAYDGTSWVARGRLSPAELYPHAEYGRAARLSGDRAIALARFGVVTHALVGHACSDATDCATESCEDGVCCDAACTAPCATCAAPGGEGICGLRDAGSRPRDGCLALCDGASSDCPQGCDEDDDCVSGASCQAGVCAPLPPPDPSGTPCDDDGACASGHCADGVCCDSACDAPCGACDLPDSVGTCTPVARGTDGGCVDYFCDGTDVACPDGCDDSDVCPDGRTCDVDTATCVEPCVDCEESETGGGCATSRRGRRAGGWWVLAIAAAALTRRRRR